MLWITFFHAIWFIFSTNLWFLSFDAFNSKLRSYNMLFNIIYNLKKWKNVGKFPAIHTSQCIDVDSAKGYI